MVTTILHELAHGLGFGPAPHDETYAKFRGRGEVYAQYLLDTTTGKNWNEMTEREPSSCRPATRARVVWNGVNVRRAAPEVFQPGAPETARLRSELPSQATTMSGRRRSARPLRPEGLIAEVAAGAGRSERRGPLRDRRLLAAPERRRNDRAHRSGRSRDVQLRAKGRRTSRRPARLGLIVVNNVEGTFPIGLNGTDPAVTITAVHVTLATGSAPKVRPLDIPASDCEPACRSGRPRGRRLARPADSVHSESYPRTDPRSVTGIR